ncbi:MAG: hypothetical protein LRZ84_21700 [Desertifilum sp.]|nr:hypothetical protein [Desertifilum sp.]
MNPESQFDWSFPAELIERIQNAAAIEQIDAKDWVIQACEARLQVSQPTAPNPPDRASRLDYESVRAIVDRKFPKNRISQGELDRWLMIYLAVLESQEAQPPQERS